MVALNIYKSLNEITDYIEDHLEDVIDYDKLAKIMGVNAYTMKSIFSLLTNLSLSDYIRKRRLSSAGFDLYHYNLKIIDVAMKYQYDNATSFSRAFKAFHGIKPSKVKTGEFALRNFPKIVFLEDAIQRRDMPYEIIGLDSFTLYGKSIKTTTEKISVDAPEWYSSMKKRYKNKYGNIDYGMVSYENRYESNKLEYWILWDQQIEEFDTFTFPKSKWLLFHINSTEAIDIQKASHNFYELFLPSCKYNLREIPELEHYHDGVTDFLVPIE